MGKAESHPDILDPHFLPARLAKATSTGAKTILRLKRTPFDKGAPFLFGKRGMIPRKGPPVRGIYDAKKVCFLKTEGLKSNL